MKATRTLIFYLLLFATIAFSQYNNDCENAFMVQKNRFPSRSKLYLYSTVEEAKILDREKSLWCKTLNGPWKFNWVIKPTDAPDDFYKEDYDVSEWDDIEVYLRRNNAIGTPNTRGRQGFDSWIRTKDKVA